MAIEVGQGDYDLPIFSSFNFNLALCHKIGSQQMNKEKIGIAAIFTILIIAGVGLDSCVSAQDNLTKKDVGCNQITEFNAAICCLQFMSSKTGNDSKDVVCRPLIDELTKLFKQKRKRSMLEFCSNESKKKFGGQKCLDALN